DIRDLHRLHVRLQHAVIGAGPEVEEYLAIAGLDEIARAHPFQGRCRCPGSEEAYSHLCCIGTADECREDCQVLGRAASAALIVASAASRSAPASGRRGPRTRSLPMPTSC